MWPLFHPFLACDEVEGKIDVNQKKAGFYSLPLP
jgi:hypothetical protein